MAFFSVIWQQSSPKYFYIKELNRKRYMPLGCHYEYVMFLYKSRTDAIFFEHHCMYIMNAYCRLIPLAMRSWVVLGAYKQLFLIFIVTFNFHLLHKQFWTLLSFTFISTILFEYIKSIYLIDCRECMILYECICMNVHTSLIW